ncbi:MAG: hypothetical protein QM703_07320 [Gemmatales bacterium]
MFTTSFARWIKSLSTTRLNRQARRARKDATRYRLNIETLEARDVPSTTDSLNAALRGVSPATFNSGINSLTNGLNQTLNTALTKLGSLPLVGNQLLQAARPVYQSFSAFNNRLQSAVSSLYASTSTDLIGGLQNQLYSILGPSGLKLLQDGNDTGSDISVTDVVKTIDPASIAKWFQLDTHLAQQFHIDVPLDLALSDLGVAQLLPGLDFQMAANNGVRIQVSWDAYVGVGFDMNSQFGFYFNTDTKDRFGTAVPEFKATMSVFAAPPKNAVGQDVFTTAPGLSASAEVGLLLASATDGTSSQLSLSAPTILHDGNYSSTFTFDYTKTDGTTKSVTVTASGNGAAALAVNLTTALNNAVKASIPAFHSAIFCHLSSSPISPPTMLRAGRMATSDSSSNHENSKSHISKSVAARSSAFQPPSMKTSVRNRLASLAARRAPRWATIRNC